MKFKHIEYDSMTNDGYYIEKELYHKISDLLDTKQGGEEFSKLRDKLDKNYIDGDYEYFVGFSNESDAKEFFSDAFKKVYSNKPDLFIENFNEDDVANYLKSGSFISFLKSQGFFENDGIFGHYGHDANPSDQELQEVFLELISDYEHGDENLIGGLISGFIDWDEYTDGIFKLNSKFEEWGKTISTDTEYLKYHISFQIYPLELIETDIGLNIISGILIHVSTKAL